MYRPGADEEKAENARLVREFLLIKLKKKLLHKFKN